MLDMNRREFITLLGGAATALPFPVLAQQRMPLVGFLNSASPDTYRFNAELVSRGLGEGRLRRGQKSPH